MKNFLKDFGEIPCFSILVINCKDFKISENKNNFTIPTVIINGMLNLRNAVNEVSIGCVECFSEEDKRSIYNYIKTNQYLGREIRQVHSESVKQINYEKKRAILHNQCPYCKAELILRNGKYGEFWGCSNYPQCKYTRKIGEYK